MKKLTSVAVLMLTSFAFMGCQQPAQKPETQTETSTAKVTVTDGATKSSTATLEVKPGEEKMMMMDGVMMKGGKMMIMSSGEMMEMKADMTFWDGMKVMMDGTVTKSDGTTLKMKEGESMHIDPKTMRDFMLSEAAEIYIGAGASAGKEILGGVMMKDGKMMEVYEDGTLMQMKDDMTIPGGMKVMMDGTVVEKDGSTQMMKEGTMITTEGFGMSNEEYMKMKGITKFTMM